MRRTYFDLHILEEKVGKVVFCSKIRLVFWYKYKIGVVKWTAFFTIIIFCQTQFVMLCFSQKNTHPAESIFWHKYWISDWPRYSSNNPSSFSISFCLSITRKFPAACWYIRRRRLDIKPPLTWPGLSSAAYHAIMCPTSVQVYSDWLSLSHVTRSIKDFNKSGTAALNLGFLFKINKFMKKMDDWSQKTIDH